MVQRARHFICARKAHGAGQPGILFNAACLAKRFTKKHALKELGLRGQRTGGLGFWLMVRVLERLLGGAWGFIVRGIVWVYEI